jgi:hypothetical protein
MFFAFFEVIFLNCWPCVYLPLQKKLPTAYPGQLADLYELIHFIIYSIYYVKIFYSYSGGK